MASRPSAGGKTEAAAAAAVAAAAAAAASSASVAAAASGDWVSPSSWRSSRAGGGDRRFGELFEGVAGEMPSGDRASAPSSSLSSFFRSRHTSSPPRPRPLALPLGVAAAGVPTGDVSGVPPGPSAASRVTSRAFRPLADGVLGCWLRAASLQGVSGSLLHDSASSPRSADVMLSSSTGLSTNPSVLSAELNLSSWLRSKVLEAILNASASAACLMPASSHWSRE
mmetsp:Transcript_4404/g.13916  ORF Transcript_4404/g.13916 Transcript_4404/m.13916 type:complete len:225 (-) Transcript_4404:162-836(-)